SYERNSVAESSQHPTPHSYWHLDQHQPNSRPIQGVARLFLTVAMLHPPSHAQNHEATPPTRCPARRSPLSETALPVVGSAWRSRHVATRHRRRSWHHTSKRISRSQPTDRSAASRAEYGGTTTSAWLLTDRAY